MQPLYTETEFKTAKSRNLLPLECLHCRKTFHKTKADIQRGFNPLHFAVVSFCSHKCQREHETPPILVICSHCKTQFKKTASQSKRSKSGNHFCSRSCSGTYNNLHKKHGTRRSKLEKWLEEQLTTLYPDLEIHFNRKDAIESELDIFIPSLRLAFELNGIYHYEPIHGQDKLNSIQSNDHRKMLACAERNIEMCSIDTSSFKYFKEQRTMKFLKIIQDIIDSRLSGS